MSDPSPQPAKATRTEGVASVETVRGPVELSRLGTTLMHEHVFVLDPELLQNYPEDWGDEEQRIADAAARLNELKSRGVDTIVDLTVIGMGRYIPRIQRVAERTTINVIVATGIYTYNDVPLAFHFRGPGTVLGGHELITEMFVRDIERGIGNSGVKAAILKCATDEPGITLGVERILRATAQAHRQTGAPITTHTHAATRVGLDQQRILHQEGVDLSRVIIGHSGDTTDLRYLEELIANGSYLGLDRFGLDSLLPFEERVTTVATLCASGYAAKMVLSHDASCFLHWIPGVQQLLPRWNYMHISNDVIPALRKKGVTTGQLHTMLVENPTKIFSRRDAY